MTESEARNILLVRAFEQPLSEPWCAADQTCASTDASRVVGEHAPYAQWVAQRAALASARLAQRLPAVARTLATTGASSHWLVLLPCLAFALGLAGDAIGSAQRINILAPPFLALIAWNLAVYAAMLLTTLRTAFGGADNQPGPGPLKRALSPALQSLRRLAREPAAQDSSHPALVRFLTDWLRRSQGLQRARMATMLHFGAAAVSAGMLASLYVRGLAFEYRAGWDSTFLTPPGLANILSVLLGPAAHLSGIALPEASRLAELRFSVGTGENAAPWIHLYALTVSLLVLLPRAVLGAFAAWRVHRATHHFALSFDDRYFKRLGPAHAGKRTPVLVLPYSYQLPSNLLPGLDAVLERELGPGIALRVAEPIALGGEDDLAHGLTPAQSGVDPDAVVVLFTLSATPERENHGALIEALTAPANGVTLAVVLIDESGFRARFGGPSGETRLMERRGAWQRLLHEWGQTPVFVDLAAPDLTAAQSALPQLRVNSP